VQRFFADVGYRPQREVWADHWAKVDAAILEALEDRFSGMNAAEYAAAFSDSVGDDPAAVCYCLREPWLQDNIIQPARAAGECPGAAWMSVLAALNSAKLYHRCVAVQSASGARSSLGLFLHGLQERLRSPEVAACFAVSSKTSNRQAHAASDAKYVKHLAGVLSRLEDWQQQHRGEAALSTGAQQALRATYQPNGIKFGDLDPELRKQLRDGLYDGAAKPSDLWTNMMKWASGGVTGRELPPDAAELVAKLMQLLSGKQAGAAAATSAAVMALHMHTDTDPAVPTAPAAAAAAGAVTHTRPEPGVGSKARPAAIVEPGDRPVKRQKRNTERADDPAAAAATSAAAATAAATAAAAACRPRRAAAKPLGHWARQGA